MTLPCDCELAGYCDRHALVKDADEVEICQNDPIQRAFDDKMAPERRHGLVGDKLARLFASVGITKERYTAAKEVMGFEPVCDCAAREAYLNRLSALAKRWASGKR